MEISKKELCKNLGISAPTLRKYEHGDRLSMQAGVIDKIEKGLKDIKANKKRRELIQFVDDFVKWQRARGINETGRNAMVKFIRYKY
jgi:transcriptional regulator with XRE-family HTH domain